MCGFLGPATGILMIILQRCPSPLFPFSRPPNCRYQRAQPLVLSSPGSVYCFSVISSMHSALPTNSGWVIPNLSHPARPLYWILTCIPQNTAHLCLDVPRPLKMKNYKTELKPSAFPILSRLMSHPTIQPPSHLSQKPEADFSLCLTLPSQSVPLSS